MEEDKIYLSSKELYIYIYLSSKELYSSLQRVRKFFSFFSPSPGRYRYLSSFVIS